MFRDLTWQVEECVKYIKALCIISLDELVWVTLTDLRAGKREGTFRSSWSLLHTHTHVDTVTTVTELFTIFV